MGSMGSEGGGGFGCDSLHEGKHREHIDKNHRPKPMSDAERAGPAGISYHPKKLAATAHSDHGPHHSTSGHPAPHPRRGY